MKFFLPFLVLFSSCVMNSSNGQMSVSEFDLKLTKEWIYTTSIENLKYNNEIITRPPGFEQLVMELTVPSSGGLADVKHCLYYQVPYKEKIGLLRVQEVKKQIECPDSASTDNALLTLSGVDNFKVIVANYKIIMNFNYDKKQTEISIPTPNIELGLVHEKYRPLTEKRLIPGLRLLKLNEDSFDFASNKYLGQLSDRFARGTAIRCQQVNKDCETVGENRCEQCRYGWYEVVDFQSPQGGSKFCGQNHCGEKNEPACPRGVKVVNPEEAGICQNDLEPSPNLEKILICQ
jgi:hypothetical protein